MTVRDGLMLATAMLLSAGQADAAPGKTDPGEKLVCKYNARTGTRFATKICRTVAQWDRISVENQRSFKDTVDRPQIKICGPATGCD